jgi:hypothetical protein
VIAGITFEGVDKSQARQVGINRIWREMAVVVAPQDKSSPKKKLRSFGKHCNQNCIWPKLILILPS